VTRFEKITLTFSLLQTVAMVAIPIMVWKLLDPALEELHYKKEPILTELVSTADDKTSRDYKFEIQNLGKFAMDHVSLLIVGQSPGITIPTKMCTADATSIPCVDIWPHIPIEFKPGENGQFPRIALLNPIPGETRVKVSLHGMEARLKEERRSDLRVAVSSDNGSAVPSCILFGTFGGRGANSEGHASLTMECYQQGSGASGDLD
jgi:hypothetical protein